MDRKLYQFLYNLYSDYGIEQEYIHPAKNKKYLDDILKVLEEDGSPLPDMLIDYKNYLRKSRG